MDFFAQQARVRLSSRRLVLLFALAVLAIVLAIDAVVWFVFGQRGLPGEPPPSNVRLLLVTSFVVIAGIVLSSLYRIASLAGGGKGVAQTVGALEVPVDTIDPQLRRLRNVVEEVAIAAGVPVPDLYLMPNEPGINAFAAGYSPADAVVCVTQGCLDQLTRDELQGVVAHEFSHVLNGDMRLNIRLMGLLFGILVLAIVGQRVLWFGGVRDRRREGGGSGQVWLIGLALIVVGYIGYFFARLIQASVSRSRESLADISAVQFTRQTRGIADALKKIAVASDGSTLRAPHRHEVAHMLFGEADRFTRLFATHPPLLQRIRALEPGFREEDLSAFAAAAARAAGSTDGDAAPSAANPAPVEAAAQAAATHADGAAPRAGGSGWNPPGMPSTGVVSSLPTLVVGAAAAATAMQSSAPDAPALARAAIVRGNLPQPLVTIARQPAGARLLVLALVLSAQPDIVSRQRRMLADAFGDDVERAVRDLAAPVAALADEARLPLVELAFPALRQLAPGESETLLTTLDTLVRADGEVDLDEYCLTRLLRVQLAEAQRPRSAPVDGQAKLTACRDSIRLVCAVVAGKGNADETAARRAWLVAMQHVFPGEALEWPSVPRAWQQPFDRALDELDGLLPAAKELVIQALVRVVRADATVTVAEAELLRVIGASMHCPIAL